jgi:molybdopterin-containing oxidoreductase family iron-sulfur binding subunit
MNHRLGNVGKTVIHTDPIEAHPVDHAESLRALVADMDRGRVEVLVILGGNPVFTAPDDLQFTQAMQKVAFRAHLSLYQDETSRQCHWHLPEAHYLEAWSDTRAFDGTASIVQPLIEPLYHGRSAHELLAMLTGNLQMPGLEIVRSHWQNHHHGRRSTGAFDDFWRTALHDGVIAGTELPPRSVELEKGWQKHLAASDNADADEHYELVFQPDPTIYDGRFANNGWLQELPKPITRLTWDNVALVSPATAKKLGVALGGYAHGGEHGGYLIPVLELKLGERSVRAPVWVVPGHADDTVTVSLGYGRDSAGKIGGTANNRVGFNAYQLVTSARPWFSSGLVVQQTPARALIACTQEHQLMENREIVRANTLEVYKSRPDFSTAKDRDFLNRAHKELGEVKQHGRTPLTMYPPKRESGHQWGMAIDLTTCTGCSACVVACQAENNIPVVGKEEVSAGREMHWLRIDRYNAGSYDAPDEFYFQPVPCMHCENAPCEYVCPVEATVHSADGLNDMVYQRCVGTRFCSNNCPYKVRRFNFFFFADYTTPSIKLQYNPDVTVRSRGVMEKCTYCVQRIRHADIEAQKEARPIFDGEILTACQAACPAHAIVFGNIKDDKSEVSRWKDSPLNYSLLGEVNTVPRTTYLAALRNPNPELEAD